MASPCSLDLLLTTIVRHQMRAIEKDLLSIYALQLRQRLLARHVQPSIPDHPRHLTRGIHVVEHLFLFECIHTGPEARISIGDQLPLSDQALKRLHDQLLTFLNVVENLLLEDKEAAIDP